MTRWQRWLHKVLRLPLPPTDAAAGIPERGSDTTDIARLRREQEEQAAALSVAIATYRKANMERHAEVSE